MTQPHDHEDENRHPAHWPPEMTAMREMLTAVALTRVALARRLDMSVHDVEVMEHVMLADPGEPPLGPVELSRRLGISSAAATQSVTRLQRAGHLVRNPHPQDRRRLTLEATASGREHLMSVIGPMLELLSHGSQHLNDRERHLITRYLAQQTAAYHTFLDSIDDPERQSREGSASPPRSRRA